MRRIKAKTSPTGYVVMIAIDGDEVEFPVIRFDEEGFALHGTIGGHLVRSVDQTGFRHLLPLGAFDQLAGR
jgi:hypothetical protein